MNTLNIRKEDDKKTTIYRFNRIVLERNQLVKERELNADNVDDRNIKLRISVMDLFNPVAKYKGVKLDIIINGDRNYAEFHIRLKHRKGQTLQSRTLMFHEFFFLNNELDFKKFTALKMKLMDYIDYFKSFAGLVDKATEEEKNTKKLVDVAISYRTKYFK